MELFLESFLNPGVMRESVPYLLQGLGMTLKLAVLVVPIGIAGGLVLGSLHALGARWLRVLLVIWVDFFRAFPPLVLLVFVYYGLPFVGVEVSSVAAVALAFLLNTSSYYGEIFRAGIESVPRGQWEAARSTGLSAAQALVHVVLPQGARNVLPDLASNTLEVIKLTSLASVVALPELLRMARVVQGITFNPTPLVLAALLYLALLWPLVRLLARVERRFLS
jgi:polar amino acid transport system permease protein